MLSSDEEIPCPDQHPIAENWLDYFFKKGQGVPFCWIRYESCAEMAANSTFMKG